ncbi:hypothetical protein SEA_LILBEANIE_24 [Gordonia phage Lilbeanie]|uniref:Uncharacterized protein n=1 Tax=Gordonia phage Lilbeanie TaxID=2794947 RepID=A0A7T1NXQ3_9CAUD|nr:hypothetical protein J1773_gp24 [Gordonia phage Lilbeanie]QPO17102.1 hypothetical protein SEA_LILBEANIE_24 [Gordonia phage Lilbeanie]
MAEVTVRAAQRVLGLAHGDEVRITETPKVKGLIRSGALEVVTRHRRSGGGSGTSGSDDTSSSGSGETGDASDTPNGDGDNKQE